MSWLLACRELKSGQSPFFSKIWTGLLLNYALVQHLASGHSYSVLRLTETELSETGSCHLVWFGQASNPAASNSCPASWQLTLDRLLLAMPYPEWHLTLQLHSHSLRYYFWWHLSRPAESVFGLQWRPCIPFLAPFLLVYSCESDLCCFCCLWSTRSEMCCIALRIQKLHEHWHLTWVQFEQSLFAWKI